MKKKTETHQIIILLIQEMKDKLVLQNVKKKNSFNFSFFSKLIYQKVILKNLQKYNIIILT